VAFVVAARDGEGEGNAGFSCWHSAGAASRKADLTWSLTAGRNRAIDFHPRPDGLPRGTGNSPSRSSAALRELRDARPARRPDSGLPIAIEAATGVARQQGETIMATIGAFIAQGDGYTGSIKTLTLNVRAAVLRPNEKSDDKAPDYRIFAGQTEFGAAWRKTSQQNRDYLSVKLDDPSFPAPIYASLVEAEDGHSLIWSR